MVKTVENYKFSEPKRDNLGPDVSVTDKKCSRKIQTAKIIHIVFVDHSRAGQNNSSPGSNHTSLEVVVSPSSSYTNFHSLSPFAPHFSLHFISRV